MAELAVAMDQRTGTRLILAADRGLGLGHELAWILRRDLLEVLGQRPCLPVEEAVGAVRGGLEGAEDQARERIARIAGARHAAPRVGRVACMHANRSSMHAALGPRGVGLLARAAV